MSLFDRFRKVERARHESAKDAPPPPATLERFRPQLDPAARPLAKACAKCGVQNGALDVRCAHCDAELDSEGMRAHQESVRARERESAEGAAAQRAEKVREAEQALERERARRRGSTEVPAGTSRAARVEDLDWSRPLIAVLQSTRRLPNPWLRLGAQLALVAGFFAAVIWTLVDLRRSPLLMLLLLLVGVTPRWGRRRWWR